MDFGKCFEIRRQEFHEFEKLLSAEEKRRIKLNQHYTGYMKLVLQVHLCCYVVAQIFHKMFGGHLESKGGLIFVEREREIIFKQGEHLLKEEVRG